MRKKRTPARRAAKTFTEREYVLLLVDAATDHLRAMRGEVEDPETIDAVFQRWQIARDKLSAWTLLALCEAWIQQDDIRNEFRRIGYKLPER